MAREGEALRVDDGIADSLYGDGAGVAGGRGNSDAGRSREEKVRVGITPRAVGTPGKETTQIIGERTLKTVRVHVSAGEGVEDARRAVEDVLELLNRHFRPRGVEFVGARAGEGDWTVALYGKDFSGMGREEFEKVYEGFQREKKPVIHVFFKEPDEGIDEELKAFKEMFAEQYGYFYCHFETIGEVKFEVVKESLAWLPDGGRYHNLLSVEDGEVRLGGECVTKMEELPFARLNVERQRLVVQIAEEKDREHRCKLQEELERLDSYLFETSLILSETQTREMGERLRRARELFNRGDVRGARNKLNAKELFAMAGRCIVMVAQARKEGVAYIQCIAADAKLALSDGTIGGEVKRLQVACENYEKALDIVDQLGRDDGAIAEMMGDYAWLLHRHARYQRGEEVAEKTEKMFGRLAKRNMEAYEIGWARALRLLAFLHVDRNRFDAAEKSYKVALSIWRRLKEKKPEAYEADWARTLGSLANLHVKRGRLTKARKEYESALAVYRRLAMRDGGTFQPDLAMSLHNLAVLHHECGRLDNAKRGYEEALTIQRRLAAQDAKAYEPDVARSLHSLAVLHKELNQLEEAEKECREALAIRRRLAVQNVEMYEPDMATTLNNLALFLWKRGSFGESERRYQEALTIQRRLAAQDARAHEPGLARTLHNLAVLHLDCGQFDKAGKEYEEALAIRRRLADQDAAAFEPHVAMTLCNYAEFCKKMGDAAGALRYAKEAMDIYQRCAERTPGMYEKDVVWTQNFVGMELASTVRMVIVGNVRGSLDDGTIQGQISEFGSIDGNNVGGEKGGIRWWLFIFLVLCASLLILVLM